MDFTNQLYSEEQLFTFFESFSDLACHPNDPMLRINRKQYEYHKFEKTKNSARCVIKNGTR